MEAERTRRGLELCLDFSNTVDWRRGEKAQDSLKDYGRLVSWSRQQELLGQEESARLLRFAVESGRDESALRRAVELRETIYRVFSAVAHAKRPADRDLEALNEFLSVSLAQSRIARKGERYQWSWRGAEDATDKMLWPIARSAADLLTSDQLEDVRECANEDEGCAWLFLDDTKNHSRRWCNMETCGNKAKARRFYEAHKKDPD